MSGSSRGTDHVRLRLLNGEFALIDRADEALVADRKWYRAGRYVRARSPHADGPVYLVLHRVLMEAPLGCLVDHINGDGLDNRRANLRLCSHAENMKNRAKHADTASTFKGVWFDGRRGMWRAQINVDGERMCLGSFQDERKAAIQYDRAARLFFGAFARTNADLGLL